MLNAGWRLEGQGRKMGNMEGDEERSCSVDDLYQISFNTTGRVSGNAKSL